MRISEKQALLVRMLQVERQTPSNREWWIIDEWGKRRL